MRKSDVKKHALRRIKRGVAPFRRVVRRPQSQACGVEQTPVGAQGVLKHASRHAATSNRRSDDRFRICVPVPLAADSSLVSCMMYLGTNSPYFSESKGRSSCFIFVNCSQISSPQKLVMPTRKPVKCTRVAAILLLVYPCRWNSSWCTTATRRC
jgi:hypothetical protein